MRLFQRIGGLTGRWVTVMILLGVALLAGHGTVASAVLNANAKDFPPIRACLSQRADPVEFNTAVCPITPVLNRMDRIVQAPMGKTGMQFTLSTALISSQVTNGGGTSGPSFSTQPTLTPALGETGDVFTLTLGVATPDDPSLVGTLTLDGVDVTAQIDLNGSTLTYTPDMPGELLWQVRATDAGGSRMSMPVMVTVTAGASALSVDGGAAQFLVDNALQSGVDATGRAWVVPNGTATLGGVNPAQAVDAGNVVGGMEKNPLRTSPSLAPQGYFQRGSTFDPALNVGLNPDLEAGDVLVKSVPVSNFVSGPYAQNYAVLHVVSQALPANAVLGPSIGWNGKATPEFYTVDIAAVMGLLHNHDATGMNFPPFSVLMQAIAPQAPVFAQNTATQSGNGYEAFLPAGMKGGNVAGNRVQYGGDVAEPFDIAALALHYDVYTTAQKEELVWALVRHGIEWVFPIIGSGIKIQADGGHQQFWQFAGVLALIATGREAEVADFMTATGGGNWDQYFIITDALTASDFSPHSDPTKPPLWRMRTLPAQPGGNVVRIPLGAGDIRQVWVPVGAQVIRNGRPVATVTAEAELDGSGTLDVNIDRQPEPALTAGDDIYFEGPSGSMDVGLAQWLQRPGYGTAGDNLALRFYFSPAEINRYRALQRNAGQIMALRGIGYRLPIFEPIERYIQQTLAGTWATAYETYAIPTGPFNAADGNAYDAVADALAMDFHAFMEYPQQGDIVPVTAISVSSITAPGTPTPGPLQDGVVIGLLPEQTARSVEISGTGGAGGIVQIRALRHGDDSEMMGWINVATVDGSGDFAGTVVLPKSDDWIKLELRYQGGTSVYTNDAKWAIGYKFMLLGQSQMTIMTKSDGAVYTGDPQYQGTASYYSWQEDNAGATTETESMYVIGDASDGSDGLRAFVDQFRYFDPDTPIQLMRESVNGTSILQFTDDDTAGRKWSDLTNKTDRYGADVTAVLENWNTANQSPLEGHEDLDILQGINTRVSEHGTTPDHALPDLLQGGYAYGTMPATRNARTGSDVYHSSQKITRAHELGYAVGLPMADYEIEDAGGPHPLTAGEGNATMGARMAVLAARALKMSTPFNPFLQTTATRSEDGTFLELNVNLPNGGALYSAQPAAISGFSVNEGSGYQETGFDAAIVDGKIRLTKEAGTWANVGGLQIRRDANLRVNDPLDRALEQQLVAGEMYETWAGDVMGKGMPIYGRIVGDNEWTLEGATITDVTQIGASSGGVAQATFLGGGKQMDTGVSMANRFRSSEDAWLDGSIPPAPGDLFIAGGMHISNYAGGGTDMTAYGAKDIDGVTTGTMDLQGTKLNSGAGITHSLRILSHVGTGEEVDLKTFTGARMAMTYLPVYKLTGAGLDNIMVMGGHNIVTLENVPANSTIIGLAQNRDGTPLTWVGLTEDGSHAGVFAGNITYQSVASGGGSGIVVVQAAGAEEMIVIVLPPL